MKRHLFIALIVCAVGSLPFPVHAQQPAIPVIGFLSSGLPDRYTIRRNAFQKGMKAAGYIRKPERQSNIAGRKDKKRDYRRLRLNSFTDRWLYL
jgi:hypothetical protein